MNPAPVNSSPVPKQEASSDKNKDAQLLEACREFEAILVGQLFSSMRENPMKSDLLGGGSENEMYGQMLDQEIARAVSHQEGIGLASLLFQQFTGKSPEEAGVAP